MSRWKVLCNDELRFDLDALKVLHALADVDYVRPQREILLNRIGEYDALFASASVQTDRQVLECAGRLKVIATASTGTDHIDVGFAKQRGIDVLDISKDFELLNNFSATAELAFGLLLALIRRLPSAFEAARHGRWARQDFSGRQLLGKTLGILGYGRLGKMMAEMGRGFRMRVIACDINSFEVPGIERVDFNELLSQSDVLSVHVHLNTVNRGLISREALDRMKPGAILINTSRGAIIDEAALLEALKCGKLSGAGLDVIDGEWATDLAEHPLIKYSREYDNLIISPHIGGSTVESIVGARHFMAKKLFNYIKVRGL